MCQFSPLSVFNRALWPTVSIVKDVISPLCLDAVTLFCNGISIQSSIDYIVEINRGWRRASFCVCKWLRMQHLSFTEIFQAYKYVPFVSVVVRQTALTNEFSFSLSQSLSMQVLSSLHPECEYIFQLARDEQRCLNEISKHGNLSNSGVEIKYISKQIQDKSI